MTLVIGTDEAGYGPNLGPLVVAATAWQVDAPPDEAEPLLAAAVSRAEAASGLGRDGPLWGDSKAMYRPGDGMERLERGALVAAMIVAGRPTSTWDEYARLLGKAAAEETEGESPEWASLRGMPVPAIVPESCLAGIANRVATEMLSSGVRLVAIRCRCVYPGGFNGRLARGLNKSDILSETTLALASSLAKTTEQPAIIWCDRHGGRKKYAGIVTEAFDGAVVQPLEETAARSVYRIALGGVAADGRTARIEFTVGGESRTPVAIASMTAKYVRERAMECFNRYWSTRQPGLRPTAGYPLDANRWRSDAAATIAAAGIDASMLWRRA
jgi:ribonuclease HII